MASLWKVLHAGRRWINADTERGDKILMSDAELSERLRINESKAIQLMLDLSLRRIDEESQRTEMIESKVNTVYVVLGLFVAVLGWLTIDLLNQTESVVGLNAKAWVRPTLLWIGGLAWMTTLISIVYLMEASRVRRDFRTFHEEDVFRDDILNRVSGFYKLYARYIIHHAWDIGWENILANDRKARKLERAQILVFVLLVLIGLMFFLIGVDKLSGVV